MRKRIIAFYDLLLYAIICSPLIIISTILLLMLVTKGTSEWIYQNWYLLLIFAITFMLPIGGSMLFRYCIIKNDSIHFHYFPFGKSWKNANNNIDIAWNQDIFISEILNVEIVKLTKNEKQTKIYYKHWFNKYLKIDLKYANSKYIYVGNYSNYQINMIIKFLKSIKQNFPL